LVTQMVILVYYCLYSCILAARWVNVFILQLRFVCVCVRR
jgi:hypothetical protein